MSGAEGDEMPSLDDIARSKMFAASPQAFEALFWILRSPKMVGPYGTNSYLIAERTMDKARGAMLLAGIDVEKMPVMECDRCQSIGLVYNEDGIAVLCPNCLGRGER
jgi:hypothetical protein